MTSMLGVSLVMQCLTALAAGVASSAHCVAMCGPVVSAVDGICAGKGRARGHLAFHLGRIGGYALAGAAAGSLAGAVATVVPSPAQWTVRGLTALLGVLVGLQTAGVVSVFSVFERAAKSGFTRLFAALRRRTRGSSARVVLALGMLWSFVPCGMVYAALALAATTASPWRGALSLLFFGLGTTPSLGLWGWVIARRDPRYRLAKHWRIALGLTVALLSLVQALVALHAGGWLGEAPRVVWDAPSHCDAPAR
ncbi:MAG: sulfite exporter TauE/SafE family protein [Deltaproteobacteria bacterium]|nr:sulfite exporter TauE/SafE family protein [Deltaproteobacteria bacterium]